MAAGLAAGAVAWAVRAVAPGDLSALIGGGMSGLAVYAIAIAILAPADARSVVALVVAGRASALS